MSADSGFNLLDEPWIIALGPDGVERPVSILGLFEHADEFTEIGGEVPTQAFAITRLLLAFLHRALYGPSDRDDWADPWESPGLPLDKIRNYADRVRPRFNLFDPAEPFFQVPDLRTENNEVSGLEKIVADVPNGEPLFTTRSAASLRRIDAAEATRWLVHVHAFDASGIKSGAVGDPMVKKGKGYAIGVGWSGQLGAVIPQGRSLRETLLLNLITADTPQYVEMGSARDLPPWERKVDTAEGHQDPPRPPRGPIDLYTWQTRRVRLVGDRSGVTGVVLANGDKIVPQNRQGLEPHTAWRYSDAQTKKLKSTAYMPRAHDPERSVWRGLAAILPSASAGTGGGTPEPFIAPGVLRWIGELTQDGMLPPTFRPRLRIYGAVYGAQSATVGEIVDDVLPLPVVLLRQDQPAAGHTAVAAVADADAVAGHLWSFAENLAQAAGAEPQSGAGDQARQRFYSELDSHYRAWLGGLTPEADLTAARSRWQQTVAAACRPIQRELLAAAPPAAWTGRVIRKRLVNAALAHAWFSAALRKSLPLARASADETALETAG